MENNYNIYNFSVSSYSPSVYLYKINEAIKLGIKPKKIIISLDLSDVLDETNRWIYDDIKHEIKTKKSEKNNHFKNDEFKQNGKSIHSATIYKFPECPQTCRWFWPPKTLGGAF